MNDLSMNDDAICCRDGMLTGLEKVVCCSPLRGTMLTWNPRTCVPGAYQVGKCIPYSCFAPSVREKELFVGSHVIEKRKKQQT